MDMRLIQEELKTLAATRSKNETRIANLRAGQGMENDAAATQIATVFRGTIARREVSQKLREYGGVASRSYPSLAKYGMRTTSSPPKIAPASMDDENRISGPYKNGEPETTQKTDEPEPDGYGGWSKSDNIIVPPPVPTLMKPPPANTDTLLNYHKGTSNMSTRRTIDENIVLGVGSPSSDVSFSRWSPTETPKSVGSTSDDITVLTDSNSDPGRSFLSQSLRSEDLDRLFSVAEEGDRVHLCGWLRKKPSKSTDPSVKRTWQKVWMKLFFSSERNCCCLLEYTDDSENDQIRSIELRNCSVDHDTKGRYEQYGKFLFEIRKIGAKKESLMASTEKQRSEWIDAIEKAIQGSAGSPTVSD